MAPSQERFNEAYDTCEGVETWLRKMSGSYTVRQESQSKQSRRVAVCLSKASKRARKPQCMVVDGGWATTQKMSVDLKCQHLRLSFC